MSKRVLIAMSGGIDSSVSAILLKKQNYELVGVTFRTFDSITESCMAKEKGCCSIDSIFDAKNLAQQLGFEHHILDVRNEFRKTVINNFIEEYLQCRTPNPCVICNPVIKWGLLLNFANKLHCDYLATGHYARIQNSNDRYYLQRGKDHLKDQTYFLWKLNQFSLARTIFPLGNLTKLEVRQIASDNGFTKLSQKKESEEICFITDNNYRNFLKREITDINSLQHPGNFVSTSGVILGQHTGLYNYTIGQRKGLGIAVGKPIYVIALDKVNNNVVLGSKEYLQGNSLFVKDINMMKYPSITDGMEVICRVRYRNQGVRAKLFNDNDKIHVVFYEHVESITPGQSAVFYENNDIVGGGIIC